MDDISEALDSLRHLGKKHGNILSLSLVFKTFLQDRLYNSAGAISSCLHSLEAESKIRPINFGIDIELLDDVEQDKAEYVQSSLDGFNAVKKKI